MFYPQEKRGQQVQNHHHLPIDLHQEQLIGNHQIMNHPEKDFQYMKDQIIIHQSNF
jgi:hypothetical protein